MTTKEQKSDWVGQLQVLARAASPGPWLVGHADDQAYMSASYVAAGKFKKSAWPPSASVVAVTLLQSPGLAMSKEAEANAAFLAVTREAVPRLCDEVERLRDRSGRLEAILRALVSGVASKGPDLCEVRVARRTVEEARELLMGPNAG